jgi:hypothetical protein
MRSRQQYIITKSEVHGYANFWLEKSLRLEYEGTKCTASTLLQVLLIAASQTVSIFAELFATTSFPREFSSLCRHRVPERSDGPCPGPANSRAPFGWAELPIQALD